MRVVAFKLKRDFIITFNNNMEGTGSATIK